MFIQMERSRVCQCESCSCTCGFFKLHVVSLCLGKLQGQPHWSCICLYSDGQSWLEHWSATQPHLQDRPHNLLSRCLDAVCAYVQPGCHGLCTVKQQDLTCESVHIAFRGCVMGVERLPQIVNCTIIHLQVIHHGIFVVDTQEFTSEIIHIIFCGDILGICRFC